MKPLKFNTINLDDYFEALQLLKKSLMCNTSGPVFTNYFSVLAFTGGSQVNRNKKNQFVI